MEREDGERAPPGAARCDPLVRVAGSCAAVVLALAIAMVVFVQATHRLARGNIGSARGPLLQAAGVAARDQPLIFGAGLFAAGALLNYILSRRLLKLTKHRLHRRSVARHVRSLWSGRFSYAIRLVRWDSIRGNPGATVATVAVLAWVVAAVSVTLLTFVGSHAAHALPVQPSAKLPAGSPAAVTAPSPKPSPSRPGSRSPPTSTSKLPVFRVPPRNRAGHAVERRWRTSGALTLAAGQLPEHGSDSTARP